MHHALPKPAPSCVPTLRAAVACAQALIRKYVPLVVVAGVVLLVLWLRAKFY